MANFEAARVPAVYSTDNRLTGLPALDMVSTRRRDRSGWGVYSLGDSPYAARGVRTYRFKPEMDLSDLWKAYLADGYIQRTVDLIVAMIYHTGIRWVTESPVLDNYLRARFEISDRINGYGWDRLIRTVLFDFVLYGNAFLVTSTTSRLNTLYGRPVRSPAVAAWYPVPARCMFPVVSRDGTSLEGWILRVKPLSQAGMYVERYFPLDRVVHLANRKPVDSAYGVPVLLGAVEDIRGLRQIEEEVLRMIHRFVNPRLHISTPDITGTGAGVRPDMQQIVEAINQMSSDAVLVTMPGQEVRVIGAESFALRAEPYLEYFSKRAIAGLGMNDVTIGHKQPDPDMDTLDLSLRMMVRSLQREFGDQLLMHLIGPLLDEADWSRVSVSLEFGEPDTRHVLRLFTVISNLYSQSVITLSEARRMMNMSPEVDEKDMYLWRVQLPRVLEPLKLQAELGLSGRVSAPSAPSDDKRARGRPPKDDPAVIRKRDLS
ncbi:MAG: hypothetical protein KatS3mg023_3689 [Armatimonadota bacterium]|nr:MAG: hypothetical protein KatS3mg023_3689 [Armatimonadota bacterium]